MTTKDFAIGVLGITAVILFAALVLVQVVTPQPAAAFAQNASGGDYLVTTSQLDDTAELIYILDAALQRMNVYGWNVDFGQIELVQSIDIAPLQRLNRARNQPQGNR